MRPIHDEMLLATTERLIAALMRLAPEPGRHQTAISGLVLTRWNYMNQTDTCFYAPSIAIIVQGQKESVIGNEKIAYGALDCLVNGVDMPSISRMTEAAPEKPLLAVSLNIDRAIATELAAEIQLNKGFVGQHLGVSVAPVSPDVLDTFSRLVDILDRPEHIPLRAPLLVRELITRILVGPQGAALKMIHTVGSHSNQIAESIAWLRENYMAQLHIEALAERVGMAVSSFHRQFKKVTSLSPLQYQKCLRLYEAQRLMLADNMDANNAGRAVGYDSTQQFNREYKRMFGEPPHRNIRRLRTD